MIIIESKRKKIENILKKHPNANIAVVTSQAKDGCCNRAMDIIERLRKASETKTIVLLDYNTCCNVDDVTKPLSHAYLVKAYVEGLYPFDDIKLPEK